VSLWSNTEIFRGVAEVGHEQVLPILEMEIWDIRPRVPTARMGRVSCSDILSNMWTAFQESKLASSRSCMAKKPTAISFKSDTTEMCGCKPANVVDLSFYHISFALSSFIVKLQDIYHENTRDKIESRQGRVETNQAKIHSINLLCITNVHITTHPSMVSSISVPIRRRPHPYGRKVQYMYKQC
jgi:hypothetical protein